MDRVQIWRRRHMEVEFVDCSLLCLQSGVNLIKLLQVRFTSVAMFLGSEDNIYTSLTLVMYTCRSFIKLVFPSLEKLTLQIQNQSMERTDTFKSVLKERLNILYVNKLQHTIFAIIIIIDIRGVNRD